MLTKSVCFYQAYFEASRSLVTSHFRRLWLSHYCHCKSEQSEERTNVREGCFMIDRPLTLPAGRYRRDELPVPIMY